MFRRLFLHVHFPFFLFYYFFTCFIRTKYVSKIARRLIYERGLKEERAVSRKCNGINNSRRYWTNFSGGHYSTRSVMNGCTACLGVSAPRAIDLALPGSILAYANPSDMSERPLDRILVDP